LLDDKNSKFTIENSHPCTYLTQGWLKNYRFRPVLTQKVSKKVKKFPKLSTLQTLPTPAGISCQRTF
jgi:hypothetical protein